MKKVEDFIKTVSIIGAIATIIGVFIYGALASRDDPSGMWLLHCFGIGFGGLVVSAVFYVFSEISITLKDIRDKMPKKEE